MFFLSGTMLISEVWGRSQKYLAQFSAFNIHLKISLPRLKEAVISPLYIAKEKAEEEWQLQEQSPSPCLEHPLKSVAGKPDTYNYFSNYSHKYLLKTYLKPGSMWGTPGYQVMYKTLSIFPWNSLSI